MTKTPWKFLLALSLTHFVADAISGFTVTSTALGHSYLHISLIILSYNAVAFALQPVAGLIVDRWCAHRFAIIGGMSLMGIGLITFVFNPIIALMTIAIGSAFIHVGAGALSSLATPTKSLGAAVFTAPGVVGLTLGTLAALQSIPMIPTLLTGTMAIIGILSSKVLCITQNDERATITGCISARTTFFVIALVLFVGFRSTLWLQESATATPVLILAFGFSAGIGKLAGGFVSDRFGRLITTVITTIFALFCFLEGSITMTIVGIGALQSSTGIVLSAAVQRLPTHSATIAGLILGLGLALAGIVMKLFG